MRFTIRDLFWLVAVVACLSGWAAHYVHWHKVDGEEKRTIYDSLEFWQGEHQGLKRRLTFLFNDFYGPLHNSKELSEAMFPSLEPEKLFKPTPPPSEPATNIASATRRVLP